jgi:hypothetical protein
MDNSKRHINLLLEKYWEGESTLAEEAQLTAYFTSLHVEEEFKVYAPLFTYFYKERQLTVDLEDEIMEKIQEVQSTSVPIRSNIIRLSWQKVVALAASLLLVITIGFNTYKSQLQQRRVTLAQMDTFESPEQALAQTKAALFFLSSRMNKATDKAAASISKTKSLDIIN